MPSSQLHCSHSWYLSIKNKTREKDRHRRLKMLLTNWTRRTWINSSPYIGTCHQITQSCTYYFSTRIFLNSLIDCVSITSGLSTFHSLMVLGKNHYLAFLSDCLQTGNQKPRMGYVLSTFHSLMVLVKYHSLAFLSHCLQTGNTAVKYPFALTVDAAGHGYLWFI